MAEAEGTTRVFKTAWFVKAARKARIRDSELCEAIEDVQNGQADDLGGGVFKKRLDKNIILAEGGRSWIYAYLFARRTGPISKVTSSTISASSPGAMPR